MDKEILQNEKPIEKINKKVDNSKPNVKKDDAEINEGMNGGRWRKAEHDL